MFRNYFLVALRNLQKQKTFSLINLIGLAVGMAGFAIFAHTAGVKLNADKFHESAERIFSVIQVLTEENKSEIHTAFTPAPLREAMLREFPEIEQSVSIYPAREMTLKRGNTQFIENNLLFADSNFLTFFTFKMKAGNPAAALAEPFSIVLNESMAQKYFGDADPLGQTLTLEGNIELTVTGILQNVPRTSSLRFQGLISMMTARVRFPAMDDWKTSRHTTFIRLPETVSKAQIDARFTGVIHKYYDQTPDSPTRMYLFPLLDFRLNSGDIISPLAQSNRTSVIIIFSIGVLLLVVVCINFINLSIARYLHRLPEIGMRKIIGARRGQLILQFLGESLLLAFLALPIAIILFEFIQPVIQAYFGAGIHPLDSSGTLAGFWNYPFLLKYFFGTALLVGLISGFYPALFLSSFRPVQVLKGQTQIGKRKHRGSKFMIVMQFTLSILFIALAGIAQDQFKHILAGDFGYDREQVAVINLPQNLQKNRKLLMTEIKRNPDIVSVTAAEQLPIVWTSPKLARTPNQDKAQAISVEAYGVDYNFTKTLNIPLLAGRRFSETHGDANNFLLNEAAVKKLQLTEPVGKQIVVGDKTGMVIGVVKDFLFADIEFEIPPAILFIEPDNLNCLLIKYSNPDHFKSLQESIREQWYSFAPNAPFQCRTLEDHFFSIFDLLNRLAFFLNIIGLAAVFFSCLGLFGLASFVVERRTKEIGIRKVLGASLGSIIWTIIREYLFLVLFANAIGLTVVYFGWQSVLQTGLLFLQNIGFEQYIFIIALTAFTAVIAIASQTLKSALANPVDALRQE